MLEGTFAPLAAVERLGQAGVTRLAAESGPPKATAHRLLQQLADLGAVERQQQGQYRMGPRMFRLGGAVPGRGRRLLQAAQRHQGARGLGCEVAAVLGVGVRVAEGAAAHAEVGGRLRVADRHAEFEGGAQGPTAHAVRVGAPLAVARYRAEQQAAVGAGLQFGGALVVQRGPYRVGERATIRVRLGLVAGAVRPDVAAGIERRAPRAGVTGTVSVNFLTASASSVVSGRSSPATATLGTLGSARRTSSARNSCSVAEAAFASVEREGERRAWASRKSKETGLSRSTGRLPVGVRDWDGARAPW
ncbi:helix-turn-helix domain-containing protein [Streptomyces violascens]|uniref:helix-turn-helix domain-containing protein n=1 Tax=Streptomyces violascens TaxID=67381 RepID=UPI001CFDDC12|nr:helix-turn-helix domain-containing protein [Streptomyces violascens]